MTTQHTTSPSVEEVYDRIKDTLNEYEVIISRWPEYTVALESVRIVSSYPCVSMIISSISWSIDDAMSSYVAKLAPHCQAKKRTTPVF